MTKRHLIVFVTVVVFSVATACKNEQTQTSSPSNTNTAARTVSTPDPFAAVRVTFDKDCKECHGQNGAGGPVKLQDGTRLKVPTLREGHAVRHSDSDFEKQITKGGDGMPAFADKLKAEEISQIIKFIRKEFQSGATAPAK